MAARIEDQVMKNLFLFFVCLMGVILGLHFYLRYNEKVQVLCDASCVEHHNKQGTSPKQPE